MEEGAFYCFFASVSVLWTGALILAGASVTHHYTMTKTVFTSILSVVGMGFDDLYRAVGFQPVTADD